MIVLLCWRWVSVVIVGGGGLVEDADCGLRVAGCDQEIVSWKEGGTTPSLVSCLEWANTRDSQPGCWMRLKTDPFRLGCWLHAPLFLAYKCYLGSRIEGPREGMMTAFSLPGCWCSMRPKCHTRVSPSLPRQEAARCPRLGYKPLSEQSLRGHGGPLTYILPRYFKLSAIT